MKIERIEPTMVSVPYTHRETSSRILRDGVTAVIVKMTTDEGLVGWGESCPGPNVESVYEGVKSTDAIFRGRDPWERDGIAADVLCFGSNWVATLGQFYRLSHQAHLEGMTVCKHTHGELGLMAAASHHVCLTLPNLVDGNQQTAQMMADDVLTEPLPIATGPTWGVPEGVGLCVTVDEDKVAQYHEVYRERGQFLPYQPEMFGAL